MSKNLSKASISHANGIITTKLYGIFNESSAESYREELFELVMGLKGKPFALLVFPRWASLQKPMYTKGQ